MDNVMEVLSKFKCSLDDIIEDYKKKISDIEAEEDFIQVLGDLVNYSKSDYLLLPFYDESILSRVFERVFPLSSSELNKIKAAKYLIEASSGVDKKNFLQYNTTMKDVEKINNKLSKFYEKLVSDDKLARDKEEFSEKANNYSKISSIISNDSFSALIDDVDLFEEVINLCDLSVSEIDLILNVAIRDNLKYLDNSGIISEEVHEDIADMKEENEKMQNDIRDLSNLLSNE